MIAVVIITIIGYFHVVAVKVVVIDATDFKVVCPEACCCHEGKEERKKFFHNAFIFIFPLSSNLLAKVVKNLQMCKKNLQSCKFFG